ncbi:MAG: hypothetical protein H6732_18475 [Alphaproteobacteria bacterium]|nr:hypothetical protein [Alphaproteobacteria bacterium]
MWPRTWTPLALLSLGACVGPVVDDPRCAPPDTDLGEEVVCGEVDVYFRPRADDDLGGCTRFRGSITVADAFGDELAPLDTLRRVDGELTIFRNHGLTDLRALGRLEQVGGALTVRLDDSDGAFRSLAGLERLREVGALDVDGNPWLASLDGLSCLEVVHGPVHFRENPLLPREEIDALLAHVEVEGEVTVE